MPPFLIFAGPSALPTVSISVPYYLARGFKPNIVRPRSCAEHDWRFGSQTDVIDDEALIGTAEVLAFLRSHGEELGRFGRSPGWFYQQFVKLAATAAQSDNLTFIADGDTIFSARLLDEIFCNPIVLSTGENYANYDRLVKALGLSPTPFSCVANGNFFARHPVMSELATAEGFIAVLKEHILPSNGVLDFSEYQIAGSVLEPRLGSRPVRIFRRFDLLIGMSDDKTAQKAARALQRYDAIAIERHHHSSFAKRLAAHTFYWAGRSW